jgi:hypothetical protein
MAVGRAVEQLHRLAQMLCLGIVMYAPVAAAEDPAAVAGESDFRYSDDWNIVSAPPPPGPYATVNVDPRVPGQDVARPVPLDFGMAETAETMPADPRQMPPPGAGRPALPATSTQQRAQPYTAPPPGAYGQPRYRSSPPAGYGMPGYSGFSGSRGYPAYGRGYDQGYNPGYGYSRPGQYAPAREQDIPPPPYALMPDR